MTGGFLSIAAAHERAPPIDVKGQTVRSLLKSDGGFDRAAVMRKAHREYSASRRRGDGLSFGYWLAYSWRVARDQRAMAFARLAA